jgi:hypothetical protein
LLAAAIAAVASGDQAATEFTGRTGPRKAAIVLARDPAFVIKPYENTGRDLTAAHKAFREASLGPDSEKTDQ